MRLLSQNQNQNNSGSSNPFMDMMKGLPSGGEGPDSEMDTKMFQMISSLFGGGQSTENPNPESIDSAMDNMVKSMLSKEALGQPVKEVAEKFPAWLKENENKYPKAQMDNFRKQSELFERLNKLIESNGNQMEIAVIMNEMRTYGELPHDLAGNMFSNDFFGDNNGPGPQLPDSFEAFMKDILKTTQGESGKDPQCPVQ